MATKNSRADRGKEMEMQVAKICAILAALSMLNACQSVSPVGVSGASGAALAPPAGYSRAFSPATHNYRRASASVGEPVRFGSTSERFELRHEDCDGADCTKPRARAEIQLSQNVNPARIGKNIWYGWSFYNESVPAFTRQNSLRLVFGQWTMGGGQRAILRFIQLGKGEGDFSKCDPSVCSGPDTSTGDLVVQLDDIATFNNWDDAQNNGYVCRLFDLTEQRGNWVDLTMNTNFSTGADGYLRIWVNRELVCDYSGPLVSPLSKRASRGGRPEHRRGIFSTWDKRWRESMGDARKPTLIVYYDGFRSGKLLEEVDAPFRKER